MIDLSRFGRLVKVARKSRSPRISQTDLARQVKVTQSFISDLENGRLRLGPRDPEILEQIADILGISFEDTEPSVTHLDPTASMGYLPAAPHPKGFREKLSNGRFVVTMEIHPPKGVGLKRFEREARELKNFADAVNVTDNQRALLKLSPIAGCRILLELGIEPICQLTCRDKNRLGFQSDVLSGYVLGIRNFLVIMGDPPEIGDHPDSAPVFDIHSVQAMDVISRMKHGFDMGGNKLNRAPKDILIGSAANPFPLDLSVEMSKIKAKIRAGAEFFQTQPVYDIPKFKNFLKLVKPLGIRVIAGYIPIVDRRTLEIMEDIPGVVMPRAMVERLENSADIYGEGIALARDTILELHDMVDGIHMMNIGRVTPSLKVLELVKEQVKIAI